MALGDKVDELQRTAATLIERLDNALKSLDAVYEAQRETARELGDLRRQHEMEIALLKRELEEFKKWKDEQRKERDERSRRLWAFGPNILAAVIGGLIAAAVAYFVPRR